MISSCRLFFCWFAIIINSLAQVLDASDFWIDSGPENPEDPYLTSFSTVGSSDIFASADPSSESLAWDNPNDLLTAATDLNLETTNILAWDLTSPESLTWVGPDDYNSFTASTNMNDAGISDFEGSSSLAEPEPSSSDQLEWTSFTKDPAMFAALGETTDQLTTIQSLDAALPPDDAGDFEDPQHLAFVDDIPVPVPFFLEALGTFTDSILNFGSEVIQNLDRSPLLRENEKQPKCENEFFPFCCLLGAPRGFGRQKENRRRQCHDCRFRL
jgi:hypothetical protein